MHRYSLSSNNMMQFVEIKLIFSIFDQKLLLLIGFLHFLQLYNKKNITRRFEDTHSLRSLVKHHSKINFISSHRRVISFIHKLVYNRSFLGRIQHTFTNINNQILDLTKEPCVNECKSALVLRCRSTNKTFSIENAINSYSANSSRIWADSRRGVYHRVGYQTYTTRVSRITVLLYRQLLDHKILVRWHLNS